MVCNGVFGETFYVDLYDHIGLTIFDRGYFDPTSFLVWRELASRAQSEHSYIDVGANIGGTCIGLALQGVPTIAIEPNTYSNFQLRRSLGLSGAVCETFPAIATDKEGGFTKIYSNSGNSGAVSLQEGWNPGIEESDVLLASNSTLDGLYRFSAITAPPLLIKIDVEGAEELVLAGSKELISTFRPNVLFEWSPKFLSDPAASFSRISSNLPNYTFCGVKNLQIRSRPRGASGFDLQYSRFDATLRYENVLACPSEGSNGLKVK